MEKVKLGDKLALIDQPWRPRIVADLNDCKVQLAKFEGDFVWHKHDDTDDFFLVLHGRLLVDLPDGQTVELLPGELLVVPRGVEHRPRADEEVHVLSIERRGTVNTGDAPASELTAPEARSN